jgi:hypothetical protein
VNSILELAAGLALATAAVFFVLRPLLSPPAAGVEAPVTMEGEDPDDDLSPRAVALRALKEIEFDRATGKLSDADYDALNAKYTAEALAALRDESPEAAAAPRIHPAVSPLPTTRCPTHGARPETGAIFCSACGRRLSDAVVFCAKCGTALPPDARFCAACGRRVAA